MSSSWPRGMEHARPQTQVWAGAELRKWTDMKTEWNTACTLQPLWWGGLLHLIAAAAVCTLFYFFLFSHLGSLTEHIMGQLAPLDGCNCVCSQDSGSTSWFCICMDTVVNITELFSVATNLKLNSHFLCPVGLNLVASSADWPTWLCVTFPALNNQEK